MSCVPELEGDSLETFPLFYFGRASPYNEGNSSLTANINYYLCRRPPYTSEFTMIFLILFSQSAVCEGNVKLSKHATKLILQCKCKVIIKN